jgi:DNA polymerase-3 subunit epsilon
MKQHLTPLAAILQRPVVFFDLETTGTNVSRDRIVELSMTKVYPNGKTETTTMYVNPGIPIPAEATKVHQISDEMVAGANTFKVIAPSLFEYLKDCDLGGYNIISFDVPLLAEEFLRSGFDFPANGVRFLDACTIFKKKFPRTLAGAYSYYIGGEMQNAHSAEADVLQTIEVFEKQLEMYEELQDGVETIDEFCDAASRVDFAGSFIRDEEGEVLFNFGKHKGRRALSEPSYLQWMLGQDFPLNTKRVIKNLLTPQANEVQ